METIKANKVKNSTIGITQRKAALIAGFGLLIMTVFAIFGFGFVFPGLIAEDDPVMTAKNILDNEMLFRSGLSSYFVVIILDLLVAWGLYVFLIPVNKSISLLMAWSRLVYTVIFAVAMFDLVNVLQLFDGASYPGIIGKEQVHAYVMLNINAFNDGWSVGYIFFGLHLMLLGYLAFRSEYIPGILGILLILAGVGYFIDHFGKFLIPGFNLTISMVLGWGELIFMFWLIFKGGKMSEKEVSK